MSAMLRHAALLLLLAALCLSSLPASQASVLSRLQDVHLAKQRAVPIARSTDTPSASSSSVQRAVRQLDCPIAANWTSSLNSTGLVALAPLAGCTLLAVVEEAMTLANVLYGLDASDGSVQWSLRVSDGNSEVSIFTGVTVSPSLDRVYIPFSNTSCGWPSCYAVSAVDVAGGKPRLLWNRVFPDITQQHPALQTLTAKAEGGRRGVEVLAAFSAGEWTTLDGATGRVLSTIKQPSGHGPAVLADGLDGRVLMTNGNSATAYQVHANGTWAQAGQVAWDAAEERRVSFFEDEAPGLPRLPALLVVQSSTQPDHIQAVDVATGATVWNVSGADVLTGKWLPGGLVSGLDAQWEASWSVHPLNASWALVTARAWNGTDIYLRPALLDLTTGAVAATAPLVRLPQNGTYNPDVEWRAASGRLVTHVGFIASTAAPSFYLAYTAALQPLSRGLLPPGYRNPLSQLEVAVAALAEDGASIVSASTDQHLVGRRYTAQPQQRAGRRATGQ